LRGIDDVLIFHTRAQCGAGFAGGLVKRLSKRCSSPTVQVPDRHPAASRARFRVRGRAFAPATHHSFG